MFPVPAILFFAFIVISSNADELDNIDQGSIDFNLPANPPVIQMLPSAFRADNGKYLIPVVVSGFTYIKALGTTSGSSESIFTPELIDGKLYLQSSTGRYACVINFTGRIGALDEEPDSRRCPIEAVKNDDGTVSLKNLYRNKYMCRVNTENDQSSIRANKDEIDDTCKFTVEEEVMPSFLECLESSDCPGLN